MLNQKNWIYFCAFFAFIFILSSEISTANAQTNTPPIITIVDPDPGIFTTAMSITFFGGSIDNEDGSLNDQIEWSSNISGHIGTGYSFNANLPVGDHTITASVTDSGGLTSTDTLSGLQIVASNLAPLVTIETPSIGDTFENGVPVTFVGSASDDHEGDLSEIITWKSDIDGDLATGASFTTSQLSLGIHVITAKATDSLNFKGQDFVTIMITDDGPSNTPPTVSLTSPSSGSESTEGDPVAFQASATDDEDGSISSSIQWTSSIDNAIGTGFSFTKSNLSVGVHTITATVTDSQGASDSEQVTITINAIPVNTPPTVSLTSPSSGSESTEGDPVAFQASATDNEDGSLSSQIQWTSSIDNAIGTGFSFTKSNLSVGVHTITATVTDSQGASDSEQVTITINAIPVNTPPTVSLTSPSSGSESTEGDPVAFQASATDDEDGSISSSIQWTSSIDNAIGTGFSFTKSNLSVGVHTITATVTDNGGLSDSDQVSITISTLNSPPSVGITSPSSGSQFTEGNSVTFSGWAADPEQGGVANSLQWTSSIDNAIGTGKTFTKSNLSVGVHTITATVTDSQGASDSEQVTITINAIPVNTPPTVSLTSPSSGSESTEGDPVAFQASATDDEDGSISSSIQWTSSIDNAIGTGFSFTKSNLSVGVHTITATVTDNGGLSDSDQVPITIIIQENNSPPSVGITSPSSGSQFTEGNSVTFSGWAADPEQGGVANSIQWTSSIDNAIGTGKTFTKSNLSVGVHTITATVTDNGGLSDSDQVPITIIIQENNSPPSVGITSPSSGSQFTEGNSVTFSGWAADPEQGGVANSLQWTSSIDNAIGTGKTFTKSNLSVGAHTITATVTDSQGTSDSEQVTITINAIPVNTPPTVSLTSPSSGSESTEGDPVAFQASATDDEDGSISSSIQWTSSIDNAIGTGFSFTKSNLSVGTHTITATVTDSQGASDSEQVTITINAIPVNTPPTVSLTSPSSGSESTEGDPVAFQASATDNEDGSLSSQIQWSSSIDNAIGSGASFSTTNLSVGTHTITATVTDSGGLSDSDSLTLTINQLIQGTITITNPQDNEQVSGPFTIDVILNGYQGSTTVTFKINGNVVATDNTSPYSASFNAGQDLNKGSNSIVVEANDGNSWDSDGITLRR